MMNMEPSTVTVVVSVIGGLASAMIGGMTVAWRTSGIIAEIRKDIQRMSENQSRLENDVRESRRDTMNQRIRCARKSGAHCEDESRGGES